MFRHVTGKFKGMRKVQKWTVYPSEEGQKVLQIQSNTRIAQVNLETGKAIVSKARSSGAYGVHLSAAAGATEQDCPQDILEQLKALEPTGKVVRLI